MSKAGKEQKKLEDGAIHEKYSKLFKDSISEIWKSNRGTNYILHVGKTNSGKTYNAIQRLKEVGSGVYLAPLRLLAWEVYDKLNTEGYRCNLVTGEEQMVSETARITASTIEMVDYNKRHEVAIIDESFMIGDRDRGKSWLSAILNIKADEVHIILNEEALVLITKVLYLTDRAYSVKQYEMLQKFTFSDKNFVLSKGIPKRGIFVTFSRINVLINKMKLENLGFNVSVLYGNLPPEVKKKQIEDFIEGKTDFLVSTDVIGMGINVPCDYIVFLEIEKFDGLQTRRLNSVEVKQIAGRTGRYGMSSGDAFVSAINLKCLGYLQKKYDEHASVDKACFGLTFEMFSSFGEEMTLYNRLRYFKEVDFIPDRLKGIIFKESIDKYTEICDMIAIQKFDLQTQWYFLTAPVKYNNKQFFYSQVSCYSKNKILQAPSVTIDYADAMRVENAISEIELYLNLTRNLNHDISEKENATREKHVLIDKLTSILMDKKLASKKQCKLCSTMLDLTYPYPNCQDCFENKIKYNYDRDFYGRW